MIGWAPHYSHCHWPVSQSWKGATSVDFIDHVSLFYWGNVILTSLTCHQPNSCKDWTHWLCWMLWCTSLWGPVCWAASRKRVLQPADLTSQCNGQLEVTSSMWIVYLQASKTPVTKKVPCMQLVHNLQKVFCEIRWAVHTCRPCRQESELLEVIQAFNWLRRIEVAGGTCLYQISVHCAEIKKTHRSYRRNTNRLHQPDTTSTQLCIIFRKLKSE